MITQKIMLVYKVVEIKQQSMVSGFMRATDLQRAINQWASLGWTLDRISAGETARLLVGSKDVFLLIFKKEIEMPQDLYLMIENRPYGPIEEGDLGNLRSRNLLSPSTLATKQGMDEWKPITEIIPGIIAFFNH